MTNDADYYPICERIRRCGKEVFLLSPEPDASKVSGKLKEAVGGETHVLDVVQRELAKEHWEWEGLHRSWPETQTAEFLSGALRYEQNMYEQAWAEWNSEWQRQHEIEMANMWSMLTPEV